MMSNILQEPEKIKFQELNKWKNFENWVETLLTYLPQSSSIGTTAHGTV